MFKCSAKRFADDDKYDAVEEALKSLINKFLDDGNNTIALVTFAHTYDIKTGFTTNRDLLLSEVSDISKSSGVCNYYQGLNGAERVLSTYTHDENRNTIIIFLTDSEPSEEVLYQSAEYRLIKRMHPYVTINAVQYRISDEVIGQLTTVADNHYIADEENIEDVIFEASVAPYSFEQFVVTDLINDDYFTIDGIEKINASLGSVALEYEGNTPKITWNLTSKKFRSGTSAKLEIDVKLKTEFVTTPGVYSTNKGTTAITKLPEVTDEDVATNSTPILKTDYKVTYVSNEPDGCTANEVPAEEVHYVYETIPFTDAVPTCNGYTFKGWKIAERHLASVNSDYFIMPSNDIHIVAVWGKPDISKSMDGTIHTIQTLYDVIADKTLGSDTKLKFNSVASDTNGLGVNTVASTVNDEYPVHYFRGNVDDNNVLFAGICWKAVRTTSTGGVKLIYYGEPDSNNRCESGRDDHEGYGESTTRRPNDANYYFGTDFQYIESEGVFKLTGVKALAKYGSDTIDELTGKYTCLTDDVNATCATMYFVEGANDNYPDRVNLLPLTTNIPYYSIAKTEFNVESGTLASMGYMRGETLTTTSIYLNSKSSRQTASTLPKISFDTTFWYADDIYYDEDTGKYNLVNPFKISSRNEADSLIGKYTFRNSSESYQNNVVYYITATTYYEMYYIQLENGQTVSGTEKKFTFGEGITDNGDGTYVIEDPFEIKESELGTRYNEVVGKFACGTGTLLCSNPRYIVSATNHSYDFISATTKLVIAKSYEGYTLQDTVTVRLYELLINPDPYDEYRYTCRDLTTTCTADNFSYIASYDAEGYYYYSNIILGSSVIWDGSQYTVQNILDIKDNISGLPTHHFACATLGQTTCDTVRYFFYSRSLSYGFEARYVELKNGVTAPDGVLERIFDNRTDSTAKRVIDEWYRRSIIEYADMLEDTPYCNDRSMHYKAGWSADGSTSIYSTVSFSPSQRYYYPTLDCNNVHDTFTVNPEIGNGDLTYPAGLLTMDEVVMAGNGYGVAFENVRTYLYGNTTWTMSPYNYTGNGYIYYWNTKIDRSGLLANAFQVRPVISIKQGVYIAGGDGTGPSPWTLSD